MVLPTGALSSCLCLLHFCTRRGNPSRQLGYTGCQFKRRAFLFVAPRAARGCPSATSGAGRSVLLQQYQAQSLHFHEKKDEEHIRKMIAESLGSFFHFEPLFSRRLRQHLQQVCQDLDLDLVYPTVYPALQDLSALADATLMHGYQLFQETERRDGMLASEEEPCLSS